MFFTWQTTIKVEVWVSWFKCLYGFYSAIETHMILHIYNMLIVRKRIEISIAKFSIFYVSLDMADDAQFIFAFLYAASPLSSSVVCFLSSTMYNYLTHSFTPFILQYFFFAARKRFIEFKLQSLDQQCSGIDSYPKVLESSKEKRDVQKR